MLRRDFSLFIKSLGAAVLLGLLFGLFAVASVLAMTAGESGTAVPVEIAVYNGDADSQLGSAALSLVNDQETLRSLVHVDFYAREEEALEAVENGAAAAVIVPDDFFGSIRTGQDIPCRLVLSGSNESGAATVEAYASIASDMLTSAQFAIYAGDRILKDNGADSDTRTEYNLYINVALLSDAATAKDRWFETVTVPYTSGGLSMAAHYVTLYLSFFLSVLLLCMAPLYLTDCGGGILLRLRASGVGRARFLLWKLILPAALLAILIAGVSAAAGQFLELTPSPKAILCALLAAVFFACFGALLTIGTGRLSGPLLFLLSLLGLFFCGGIIPYSRLLPALLTIGQLTPVGVCVGLLSPLYGGSFSPFAALAGMIYLLFGLLLAMKRMALCLRGEDAL